MDCDFSHDPKYLPMHARARRAPAPTWCSARATSPAAARSTGDRCASSSRAAARFYARTILGIGVRDLTGGFKCFRRAALEAIDLDSVSAQGYGFQIEMTYRALKHGFRVEEVPIVFVDRRVGQSKMSKKIFLEALTLVWKLRLAGAGGVARSVA